MGGCVGSRTAIVGQPHCNCRLRFNPPLSHLRACILGLHLSRPAAADCSALSAHFERLTTATKAQPGAPQEVELLVGLEEVARGATKMVRHHRRVAGGEAAGSGSVVLQPVDLKVQVKPGQLEGSRYVFEG